MLAMKELLKLEDKQEELELTFRQDASSQKPFADMDISLANPDQWVLQRQIAIYHWHPVLQV